MKKWTKAALLTGCACCIAGAALILCGWADGGKAYVETYDLNAFDGSATKEESISVTACTDNYGMSSETFNFTGYEVAGNDTTGASFDYNKVEHFITGEQFYSTFLYLTAQC